MKRTDILNHLISKYRLQTYLELGTQRRGQNFESITAPYKLCVDIDPNAEADFIGTTDAFFEQYSRSKFDLIFVDGSHEAPQVEKDFYNAVKCLSPGGFIVMHDCNPEEEWMTVVPRQRPTGHWNGNVYQFACQVVDIVTVDIDNGCGIVQYGKTEVDPDFKPKSWGEFDKNRKFLLNLVSWDEFVNMSF
jgi:hypothetical protein